ncbi:MAG: aldehyde dehydrogenase [Pararhodobacter sp.]|nr:aldehyde dehydrogenase [Pararhodobacter sp.]
MNLTRFTGAALAALTLAFATPAMADDDNPFAPLPPGEGAEETYYACIACHSLRTVTNGAYSRRVWDELLDWMVEDQGMMELEPDEREIILDYLATYIGEE